MTGLPKSIENLNENEGREHLENLRTEEKLTETRLATYGADLVPAPVKADEDFFEEYEARLARLNDMETRLETARKERIQAKAKSTKPPEEPEPEVTPEPPSEPEALTATEQCLKARKEIARPVPKSENVTATCRATVQENRRQLEAVRTLSTKN
jgi:hypothetical protein